MNYSERELFWKTLNNLDGKNIEKDIATLTKCIQYPRYLYRFRPVSVETLHSLRKNQLYFSSANYFDDPFDAYLHIDIKKINELIKSGLSNLTIVMEELKEISHMYGTPVDQLHDIFKKTNIPRAIENFNDFLRNVRKDVQECIQAICFSEDVLNEVLWLKYAKNHEGFVLEYDTSSNTFIHPIFPIYYSNEKYDATPYACKLTEIKLGISISNIPISYWDHIKVGSIKKRCHEYDKEWRMFYEGTQNSRPTLCWHPSSVTIGLRTDDNAREMIIDTAQSAGISTIYECYIDDNDDLNRRIINAN